MNTRSTLRKEAEKIRLTAVERRGLRERLISFMEYHPLRMPLPLQRAGVSRLASPRLFGALFALRSTMVRASLGVFATLFFVGVPVVAEQSLPGDALYAVKVRFNEEIRSQLAFSPFEKIQWEARRIERRVAEARLLAKEGKLTEATEQALEASIKSHTAASQGQLAELRASDASGAAIAEAALGSALDIQSAVLDSEIANEASSTTSNEGNVSGLAVVVREARADIATTAGEGGNPSASYEPLAARAEENTTRIYVLWQGLKAELSETQNAEIQERVGRVEGMIVTAKDAHAAGNDAVAISGLREALATTEKIVAFLSNIELRTQVSLGTLVPSVAFVEVQKAELEKSLAALSAWHTALATATTTALSVPSPTSIETLATIAARLQMGKDALVVGRFEQVKAVIGDIRILLEQVESLGASPTGEGH